MFPSTAVGCSPLTRSSLRGAVSAPSAREAAAYALSLSLSRSRPGAAGSWSTSGRHSDSSFAAAMSAPAKASGALRSVDYEVFGRVQGVCFRMYTEQEAKKLGVVGWVKNTSQGTVTGQVQGPEEKVNEIVRNQGGVSCGIPDFYWLC
ncbi:acylphosphatase-2 isoform X5 [Vidua chalybeata]|uniref:acylphosphatase-2 isoform X5 n=1 Tax=Vidua chalybeata TaxID=81927 RepID=UPI0023A89E13|nr:acylphosphatase-2 isoform X5 [Vidua chalybeata]